MPVTESCRAARINILRDVLRQGINHNTVTVNAINPNKLTQKGILIKFAGTVDTSYGPVRKGWVSASHENVRRRD